MFLITDPLYALFIKEKLFQVSSSSPVPALKYNFSTDANILKYALFRVFRI